MPFTVCANKSLRYPAHSSPSVVYVPSACHLRFLPSALNRPEQSGVGGTTPPSMPSQDAPCCIVYYSLQDFTDKWDDATGKAITTCAENKRYCPSEQWLRSPRTLSLWAEGAYGIKHSQHCMLDSTFCLSE